MRLSVTTTGPGRRALTAAVSGDQADPDAANDQATATLVTGVP